MSPAGAETASRVLVVGQDADVSIALHLHLERAGYAVFCVPGPHEVESIARVVAPHVIVLILPAAPDGTWGTALTTAQNAAKVGVRVVMVAPSREIVEPLAAVAGAERALSRSEVLSRPLVVVERSVLTLMKHAKHRRSIQVINGLIPENLTQALDADPVGPVAYAA